MNSKIKPGLAAVIAVIAFIAAYWAAGFLPTEYNLYHSLADMQSDVPLDQVESTTSMVTQNSKDAELQFCAQIFNDAADYLQDLGYKRISDVSGPGLCLQAFLYGLEHPGSGSFPNIWKAWKLVWNAGTFSKDCDILQARYGGPNYLSILIAGVAAALSWAVFKPKSKIRQNSCEIVIHPAA